MFRALFNLTLGKCGITTYTHNRGCTERNREHLLLAHRLPPHVHSKPTLSFCFQRRTSCSSSGAGVSPKLHIFDVARCCKHVATGAELRRMHLLRGWVNKLPLQRWAAQDTRSGRLRPLAPRG